MEPSLLGWVVVEHPEQDRPDLDHAVLHPSPDEAHFWADLRAKESGGRFTVHAVSAAPSEPEGPWLVGLHPGIFGVCQVVHPRLGLPCPNREGGGRQCEMFGPHRVPEECRISEHTINHSLLGNGYRCSGVNPPLEK